MNGGANSNYDYDDGLLSPTQAVGSGPSKTMAGYRNDVMNGFGAEKRRPNPVRCEIGITIRVSPMLTSSVLSS